MITKRRDFLLNIKSRTAGLRKAKRILTLILLLVSVAIPVPAASPLKHTVPAVALIGNSRFGLPAPVGLSLIILPVMLLALAGLHLAGANPRPQNGVAGAGQPPRETDTTSGFAPKFVLEKACRKPMATMISNEINNSSTLLARFCKKYNCSSAEFSKFFLRQCLKPQARPWTAFISCGGRHFSEDLELIHHVENLSDLRRIEETVIIFDHYNNFRPRSLSYYFLQRALGIRLSKRRLVDLSRKLFV